MTYSLLHHVEENVGGAAGGVRVTLFPHMGVIALIPPLVAKIVHLTDVVTTV